MSVDRLCKYTSGNCSKKDMTITYGVFHPQYSPDLRIHGAYSPQEIFQCQLSSTDARCESFDCLSSKDLLQKWLDVITKDNNRDIQFHRATEVCSRHFDDYYGNDRCYLKDGSVPHLFTGRVPKKGRQVLSDCSRHSFVHRNSPT
ncbi:hypothetical protein HPB49_008797 [Dermacentor silvarum]|uniref:Uncharacterized protein n=1 Tax=Dermacentor silvarum TaxID=543639 RepID=A0ACB8DY14_DERSI|nr:hypothetical protein HPB49_008797 [Dermacentor silvarum]